MNSTFLVRSKWSAWCLGGLMVAASGGLSAAESNDASEQERHRQASLTEVWEPVPEMVEAPREGPPSDAIVLFNGENLDSWQNEQGEAAEWLIEDGAMTVARGSGGIETRESFCDVQLHVEWRAPEDTAGYEGQDRGNSGIFLQQRYEVQVLDSWHNPTYPNGQAASIYKQHIPLVNASREPGEWQSYDIVFTAPRFDDSGELNSPANVTVLHNGVLVQNHVEIEGSTEWIGAPEYEAHGCAPIFLQDHDADVSYRNIWVRPLDSASEAES
ncbi:3-keto-disaccharide hydrolase [Halomonas huangheensis]|uniref:3-keto-alpha-glucoside-1,2-lyase/3-keto-2-hydroxy-glucal hydratase domain-containing protein n=1 Tax=Halomonas huangheensis TaxID=1178482 RepID=W1NCL4_9GAMM|nr:DUF1080 domain-containing protein [Halomonas huangheensis]ALM52568.1 large, multifunctional secreted protein [Halomonas huangheensis]ERL52926.1 hypothetical protein BJB45_16735 [Halomonas huangheensis]